MAVPGHLHRPSCFSRRRESESAQENVEEGQKPFSRTRRRAHSRKAHAFNITTLIPKSLALELFPLWTRPGAVLVQTPPNPEVISDKSHQTATPTGGSGTTAPKGARGSARGRDLLRRCRSIGESRSRKQDPVGTPAGALSSPLQRNCTMQCINYAISRQKPHKFRGLFPAVKTCYYKG
jgi:hypothetical protein